MKFFTEDQLKRIDKSRLPLHVAIIPDGNRRWAKGQSFTSSQGHQKGADALLDIVEGAKDLGIRVVTLFTFSTENWARPKEEIDALMLLLASYLQEKLPTMKDNGIRFHTIGQIQRFSKEIIDIIEKTKQETAHCNEIDLILALNYGGRDDICRAVQKMIDDFSTQKVKKEQISEAFISNYLDTASFPDPDLLIRAGGEQRISNFLLWQFSYTEIYLTDVLWPDFKPIHLFEAILDFQKRERRRGGL